MEILAYWSGFWAHFVKQELFYLTFTFTTKLELLFFLSMSSMTFFLLFIDIWITKDWFCWICMFHNLLFGNYIYNFFAGILHSASNFTFSNVKDTVRSVLYLSLFMQKNNCACVIVHMRGLKFFTGRFETLLLNLFCLIS